MNFEEIPLDDIIKVIDSRNNARFLKAPRAQSETAYAALNTQQYAEIARLETLATFCRSSAEANAVMTKITQFWDKVKEPKPPIYVRLDEPINPDHIQTAIRNQVQQLEFGSDLSTRVGSIQAIMERRRDSVIPKKKKKELELKPCTPDWEFDKALILYENEYQGQEVSDVYGFECNCGKEKKFKVGNQNRKLWPTVELAKAQAFNAFIVHKLCNDEDDSAEFERVWDECFPVEVKKQPPLVRFTTQTLVLMKTLGYHNIIITIIVAIGFILFLLGMLQG